MAWSPCLMAVVRAVLPEAPRSFTSAPCLSRIFRHSASLLSTQASTNPFGCLGSAPALKILWSR